MSRRQLPAPVRRPERAGSCGQSPGRIHPCQVGQYSIQAFGCVPTPATTPTRRPRWRSPGLCEPTLHPHGVGRVPCSHENESRPTTTAPHWFGRAASRMLVTTSSPLSEVASSVPTAWSGIPAVRRIARALANRCWALDFALASHWTWASLRSISRLASSAGFSAPANSSSFGGSGENPCHRHRRTPSYSSMIEATYATTRPVASESSTARRRYWLACMDVLLSFSRPCRPRHNAMTVSLGLLTR